MRSQFDTATPTAESNPSASTRESSVNKPATTAAATAATKEGGSCLIVGPDVKLRGAEILDCDTLVVEGRVEATMDSRVIRIAENGAFSGKVGIDVAEIHGNFDGDLTAREQLIIHATGRVSGTIRYGKILIEEGGEVSGDVQSLASAKNHKPGQSPASEDKVKPLVASGS
jgi:cytoskeletal protein CcmA (bactofilin family)